MDLRTIMFLVAASGANDVPTVEATASGNPATFTTDVKKALAGLTIPFTPIQTGSGDPAPDNIRDILGRTGIRISYSGSDTSNPAFVDVSFGNAGTVYGGTLDAITGVLTVSWVLASAKWGTMASSYSSETVIQRILMINTQVPVAGETGANTCLCNVGKFAWKSQTYEPPHFYTGYSNTYQTYVAYVYLPVGTDDDLTVSLVAPLTEPYTVQLDPVTIETLIGENNIWTDTNGSNTVTYLKKDQ